MLHVCMIASQIGAWGKTGGFGSAARAIGAGLVRRGVRVSAVVPRRAAAGQGAFERLDGIEVHGVSARSTLLSGAVFRTIGADVYHSHQPTIATWFARRAVPASVHVVTCRDPRGLAEELVELRHASVGRRIRFPVTWYHEASPLVRRAVQRADAVFCPAEVVIPRARALYGLRGPVRFLPSPVRVPAGPVATAPDPLVVFVGRWDRRKRIERFFELARQRPDIRFVAAGAAHEPSYDRSLRRRGGRIANLEMPGVLDRFGAGGLWDLYERAWVLVNTSPREGLPYTFVEAAAWECAILAGVDPDGFASRFGRHVTDDDYEGGLDWLLAEERWRARGRAAAESVRPIFGEEASIDAHLDAYRAQLTERGR